METKVFFWDWKKAHYDWIISATHALHKYPGNSKLETLKSAFPGQFPYYVHVIPEQLTHANANNDADLGGVIVDKLWVLTLASATMGAGQFRILFGAVKLSDQPKLIMTSKYWVTYPHFSITDDFWQYNDIALLRLPYALSFNTFIRPIKLIPRFVLNSQLNLVSCSYEKTQQGSIDLQWTFMVITRQSACPKKLICTRMSTMTYKNSCQWDRGSPLVTLGDDGTPTLAGLTPGRSGECDAETQSKEYIKITVFYDWIKKTINGPAHQLQSSSNLERTELDNSQSTMENDLPSPNSKKPKFLPNVESILSSEELNLPAKESDVLALALDFPTVKTPKKVSGTKESRVYFDLVTENENVRTNYQNKLPNYGHKRNQYSEISEFSTTKKELPKIKTDLPTTEADFPTAKTRMPTRKTNISTTKKFIFTKDHKKRTTKLKSDLVSEIENIRDHFRNEFTNYQQTKNKQYAISKLSSTELELPTTRTDLPTAKTDLPTTKTDLPTTKTDLPTTKTDLPTTKTDLPTTKTDLPTTETGLPATETDMPTTKSGMLERKNIITRASKKRKESLTDVTDMPKNVSEKGTEKVYFDLITKKDKIQANYQTELANNVNKRNKLIEISKLTIAETDLPTKDIDLLGTDFPTAKKNLSTSETDLPTTKTDLPPRKTNKSTIKTIIFTKGSKKRTRKLHFEFVTDKTDMPTTKTKAPATDEDLPRTMSNVLKTVTEDPTTATITTTTVRMLDSSTSETNSERKTKKGIKKSNLIPKFISAENAELDTFMFADDISGIAERNFI